NLRRARLGQPFQSRKEMEAERAAFAGEASPAAHPVLTAGAKEPAGAGPQEKLNTVVSEAKVVVNSRFDSHTTEVVKRFQVQSGLRPDGIVGNDTWGALDSMRGGTELSGEDLARVSALALEAEALFAAGDFPGALDKNMSVYSDPAAAHKAARSPVVYNIAA